MRDRFYINFGIFILIILTSILVVFSYTYKIKYYHSINMIYMSDNKYDLLVDNKELKLIRNNKSIYTDDNRYDYKIIKYNKNIIHRDKYYHELVIEINKKNKYKTNDIITGSIISKRIRLINIFRSVYS
ncbi:MAG: hypothetical protein IJL76_01320 [Bacilli bacterium]|nr:hypothetical protein [Bacilli bacterium]